MPAMADLKYRGSIQTPAGSADTLGGKPRQWTTVATVWFGMEDAIGTRWAGQAMLDGTSHVVTIRPYTGLTTAHCLLFGTRRFIIKQVVRKPDYWTLMCEEGVVD